MTEIIVVTVTTQYVTLKLHSAFLKKLFFASSNILSFKETCFLPKNVKKNVAFIGQWHKRWRGREMQEVGNRNWDWGRFLTFHKLKFLPFWGITSSGKCLSDPETSARCLTISSSTSSPACLLLCAHPQSALSSFHLQPALSLVLLHSAQKLGLPQSVLQSNNNDKTHNF